MITDSIYRIGHGHEVCQDYAVHHSDPRKDIHLAIISDGCSSSPDVDLGARALALQAKDHLSQLSTPSMKFIRDQLPGLTHATAKKVIELLNVSERALDATLLGVHMDELEAHTFVFGDGFTFYMEKDAPGILYLDHWEYSENTPFYLSVEYSYELRRMYKDLPQVLKRTSYVFRPTGVTHNETTYTSLERYVNVVSHPEELLFLGVASDGWGTFFHKDTRAPVSIEDVFKEFLEFPVATDNLLKRQVNWLLKSFDKKGILHYDDLSMAIIYNNEG